jgi:Domain of unknown function (DUF4266)
MRINSVVILAAFIFFLTGCAVVQQKDREVLSDPIMQIKPDKLGSMLEEHNRPRREGAIGGHSGKGGGCGC